MDLKKPKYADPFFQYLSNILIQLVRHLWNEK